MSIKTLLDKTMNVVGANAWQKSFASVSIEPKQPITSEQSYTAPANGYVHIRVKAKTPGSLVVDVYGAYGVGGDLFFVEKNVPVRKGNTVTFIANSATELSIHFSPCVGAA